MPTLGGIFLTGYIAAFAVLNLVAYLISSFYQKKFSQPSPRKGFLVAIALAIAYNAGLVAGRSPGAALAVTRLIALFASSIASAYSAVALYHTMKRARK